MVQKNVDWPSARSGKSQAIFIYVNNFDLLTFAGRTLAPPTHFLESTWTTPCQLAFTNRSPQLRTEVEPILLNFETT